MPPLGGGVALLKVVPVGSVSVTLTLVASLGPWLVTLNVYIRVSPAIAGSMLSVFMILKSAAKPMTVALSTSYVSAPVISPSPVTLTQFIFVPFEITVALNSI